jgi:hypothetical protein
MNKDIIYIDVEDDITAIIGKIKKSKDKIVALVPPKRIGVLQSAVNLRLLARTAENNHKHLVLITNNQALTALSATAKIPVAKNLQSKPEIAEISALEIDEGDDVIDGGQLPVGDIDMATDTRQKDKVTEEIIDLIDVEKDIQTDVKPVNKKSNIKIPDFSRFRKKLFLTIFIAPFVIGFFVWAIWFAPAAKVMIMAKTSSAPVSLKLNLGGATATDISKNIVQTVSKQVKKDMSVDFTPTGKKTIGQKAIGIITLSNASFSSAINVPAGSVLSNGKYDFVTTAEVDVPGATVNLGIVPGMVDVSVVALEVGSAYNLDADSYEISIPGLTAEGTAMTGGASHEAIVVTAEDIEKATKSLLELPTESVKQQLIAQFSNGETIISDSFTVERAELVSLPAVDVESTDGKAKITSATTFTMTAIAKSELEVYLKDAINKQITNNKTQRIYDDGIDKVTLSGYYKNESSNTVNVATTGQIGPNIDQEIIKDQIKGMKFGDVQQLLSGIKNIDNVDVQFSYFWVQKVPDDIKKIDVKFILQNE